jgi:AraC-like DNA-binding protein
MSGEEGVMFEETREAAIPLGSLVSGNPKWFHPAIRRALRYVEENQTNPVSLDDVVAAAGVSRSHFCALSQQTFGMSFMRVIRCIRVVNAGELLATTRQSVSEVGYQTGFRSLRQFERAFGQVYGCPPSLYRHWVNEQWRREFLEQHTDLKRAVGSTDA